MVLTEAESHNLPAVQHLSSGSIADLIRSAIKHDNVIIVKEKHTLQLARCLSKDCTTKLLIAAMARDSNLMISTLCDLDFAQQLSAPELQAMLQKALQEGSSNSARILCSLPAVRDITADDRLADIPSAIKSNNLVAVHSLLCQLPKAADMDSQSVAQLLQTEVQMHSSSMITSLGQLPAVKQLPAKAWTEVVTVAEQHRDGNKAVVRALMRVLSLAASGVDTQNQESRS